MGSCLAVFLSASLFGKSERPHKMTQSREIYPFEELYIRGQGTVFLHQGETPSLFIEAEEKKNRGITTEIVDDELHVDTLSYRGKKPKIYITTNNLQKLDIGDGIEVIGEDTWNLENLEISVSGSAELFLRINAHSIGANVKGGGKFTFEGSVLDQTIRIFGNAVWDSSGLTSQTAFVELNGPGKVCVHTKTKLTVDVRGGGEVRYLGTPVIHQKITNSGSVSPY